MSGTVPLAVVVLKTATLIVGGFVTLTAARAARRTGWTGLVYLAVGFGIVTLGSLLAGIADQVFGIAIGDALLVESALTALGFAVIGYSLYATDGSGTG
jgi:hypothetical protein